MFVLVGGFAIPLKHIFVGWDHHPKYDFIQNKNKLSKPLPVGHHWLHIHDLPMVHFLLSPCFRKIHMEIPIKCPCFLVKSMEILTPAPAPVPAVAPVGWAVPAQVGSVLGAEKTSWGLTND
jgi:hypothetical protein